MSDDNLTALAHCGQKLRKEREHQDMSIEEVAERLCLQASVIRHLESGAEDQLPSETFVKGYLRNYARLLGLDAASLIQEYKELQGESVEHASALGSIDNSAMKNQTHHSVVYGGTLLVGVVVMVLLAMSWLEDEKNTQSVQSASDDPIENVVDRVVEQEAVAVSVEPPSDVSAEAIEAPETEVVNESPEITDSVAVETTVLDAAEEIVVVDDTPAEPMAVSRKSLQLTFSGESWFRIQNAQGEVLAEDLLPSGNVFQQDVEPPVNLYLGNAPVVAISWASSPVTQYVVRNDKTARIFLE